MATEIPATATTTMMKTMMKQNSIQEIVTGVPDDIQH